MTFDLTQNAPATGFRTGVPMEHYLALDALGSTQLGWLAVSPLYYRHMLRVGDVPMPGMALGSAVHTAALEPELFKARYVSEPDPFDIAPEATKPRATKAYREAVAELEADGRTVIRNDTAAKVWAMAQAVNANPHVARLLQRAPEREVTLLWERDGKVCRGRADMLGDGVLVDLKTTRSLARFSPFELTRFGYPLQMAHYMDGLRTLGREIKHVILVAVESEPPYDVAVYELDEAAMFYGERERDRLFTLLSDCEVSGEWPGMFPDIQRATVTDALAAEVALADLEVA